LRTDKKRLETLIQAIHKKGLKNLTAVSNNAGAGSKGLAALTQDGRLDRIILSYLGSNKSLEKQYLTGKIAVELCPQGTLAERLRAAGAGIPAFYTATGGSMSSLTYSTLSCIITSSVCG
jgi:3-oxoacid CoA-transferase